jgi:hypothetical protein
MSHCLYHINDMLLDAVYHVVYAVIDVLFKNS